MKGLVLIAVLLLSSKVFAEDCVTVKIKAYEYECTVGQCMLPLDPAWPVRVELDANNRGQYIYPVQIGQYTVNYSVEIEKNEGKYDLKLSIETQVSPTKETVAYKNLKKRVENVANFKKLRLDGKGFVIGWVKYYPELEVTPSKDQNLCQ